MINTVWQVDTCQRCSRSERPALVEFLGGGFPEQLVNLMGRVRAVDDCIPADSVPDGFEVELIFHDGHAPGHTALWLPRQRVLIAGDMLSDVELPLPFYPDDLPSYIDAIRIDSHQSSNKPRSSFPVMARLGTTH